MRVNITILGAKQVKFENFTLFTKCFRIIDATTVDNAEDLNLVMPMYKINTFQIILTGQVVYGLF